jgi:amidase
VPTHVFAPSTFQLAFSAAIAPVLRIDPGDTVRTFTLDNKGRDAARVRRAPRGNPLTGPFYVNGAARGDTLAIRFDSIRPNRTSAHSGKRIVDRALTESYRDRVQYAHQFKCDWILDLHDNRARLASPPERLKDFRVTLRPFLGCVGVAPVKAQAFGTKWLGAWGGNLDFRGLCEGTTLYLPIYEPGALLSLGDGHAAQGDGEITGDALETSMDVVFTVDVLRDGLTPSCEGPRAEDETSLIALGIADSMPAAVQKATSTLAEWIEHDYALTPDETSLILGMSIRYEIAELVDPLINIAARIDKATLSLIGPPRESTASRRVLSSQVSLS